MTDLSEYFSAFNGCNYCTDLKNGANVAKTFRKKANIAEPTDMVELSHVAVLSNVANRLVFLLVLKSSCLLKTKYCQTETGNLSK